MVDGQQFVYYDSKIKEYIPRTEWIKQKEDETYWTSETQTQKGQEELFRHNLAKLMERFNQTKGKHEMQNNTFYLFFFLFFWILY